MNRIINISLVFLTLSGLLSCQPNNLPDDNGGTGNGGNGNTGTTLPEPPEKSNSVNEFYVDFFSTLEDDGNFFSTRDVGVASQYIKDQEGKRSVIYMFDRADYTVGESYPFNKMSYDIGIYQFFAQTGRTTDTVIKGTGIATRYIVSSYDGIAQNGTYMSGCRIPLPLNQSTPMFIHTTRIETMDQLKEIQRAKSLALLSNALIVGTVKNEIKAEVVEYIQKNMSLRATVLGSEDTLLDLLVVLPPTCVCRGIESGMKINLPYYRVLIEKWM